MNDKRFIDANELKYIEPDANAYSEEWNADYEKGFKDCLDKVMALPTVEAQPVKHEQRTDHEELIGIFGALCDYMVDNRKCDVSCPYADTKDKNDECEAWRTIQKIRMDGDS